MTVSKHDRQSESPIRGRTEAEWYDLSIDWAARLGREIPVLSEVLGPPADGGLLDAGCGTGHQAAALAERGYRVIGADISDEMLAVAGRNAAGVKTPPSFVRSAYADLHTTVGGGLDGIYCLANSLAAAGSREAVAQAMSQFAQCLRAGGRLFVQVLNFDAMRTEIPCVRGPRVTHVDGTEYLSVRQFQFVEQTCHVTNITVWRDGAWRFHAHGRALYPVSLDELRLWCGQAGLRIDQLWGGYAREPFDIHRSGDLILVATREGPRPTE